MYIGRAGSLNDATVVNNSAMHPSCAN